MKNTKFSLAYNDPKLLMAVFLFFLTFFLFLWEIIGFLQSTKQVTVTTTYRKQPVQETLHSRSALFTAPLFGDYLPANLEDADIKQSMLDAEIVGIMFDDNEEYSQVIIKVGGGPEKAWYWINKAAQAGQPEAVAALAILQQQPQSIWP